MDTMNSYSRRLSRTVRTFVTICVFIFWIKLSCKSICFIFNTSCNRL